MLSRVALLVITAFWLTMNVLLWRSEFGQRSELSSTVPIEAVWKKILTAPDNSSLEILHHGRRIGFCRWAPEVGEELSAQQLSGTEPGPEGMVRRLTGYRVELGGNVATKELAGRLRFDFDMSFKTNHEWQEMNLRLNINPTLWTIHSVAAEQTVRLKSEDANGNYERLFQFAELQNPQTFLEEFSGPFSVALLGMAGLPTGAPSVKSLSIGLVWEARNDWFKIGHSPVRVYRLKASLFDRYKIVIVVSRIGEILRVELPDEVLLLNEQLSTL